jgi:hypothetical protein
MLLSNGMPPSMAKTILNSLPQDKKDQLSADIINTYNTQIALKAEDFVKQQGFSIKIRAVTASI